MIEYYLIDPTKNITALVVTPVAIESQPLIAEVILKKEPACEQVGFVAMHQDHVELRMAGGEFCGNATISSAMLWGTLNHITDGRIRCSVSGVNEDLWVEIHKLHSDSDKIADLTESIYSCSISMPGPLGVTEHLLRFEGQNYHVTAIKLSGIIHLVTEEIIDPATAERAVRYWCNLFHADALGLMQLDGNYLTPLVYVAGINSLFWENSCASGSTAVGVYLLERCGHEVELSLHQPGGILQIKAGTENGLILTGQAKIIKKAKVLIKDQMPYLTEEVSL